VTPTNRLKESSPPASGTILSVQRPTDRSARHARRQASAGREHGGSSSPISQLTRACDLWGKTSVVAGHGNDYATIYRQLDRAQGSWCRTSHARRGHAWCRGNSRPSASRHVHDPRASASAISEKRNDQSLLIVSRICRVRRLDRSSGATSTVLRAPNEWRPRWANETWQPTSRRRSTGADQDLPVGGSPVGRHPANVERTRRWRARRDDSFF